MWRRLNKNTGRLDMAPCKYGHSEDTNKLYICLHLHDAEIQNHLLICAVRCVQFRPIHSSQIYKYTNSLTCVPLTCPGLHMEHLHYQGQQAQLATLEGPQIPHLGQWAVELHCPTNAKLPSGEVHMSRSREKT